MSAIADLGARAKAASRVLATASTEAKDAALLAGADLLVERTDDLLAANAADVERESSAGASPTVVDRLRLSPDRIVGMADGLRQVAVLADPVGEISEGWTRPNGLRISKVRVPLGVVASIYENRPNVTSDAFGLCLKSDNATVPYVIDGDGNCHVYVDVAADLAMAADIVVNAKTQRPSVCNAAESLLVHQDVAGEFLPLLGARLDDVDLVGDEATRAVLGPDRVGVATDDDWAHEFLDLELAVGVVPTIDAAIEHISRYGSGHSEAIVTRDLAAADRFTHEVDAAAVLVNASTRFVDGEQFGFGAEIGISTQKLHARGPMGLRELTTEKYVVRGDGQVRS